MSTLIDQRLEKGTIALVISSSSESYGYLRAKRNGIPALAFEKKMDWEKVYSVLCEHGISHIFLVGFMKIVPHSFLNKWQKPILNVHPSLLPKYPGLQSIRRAFDDKADVGATVHEVIADVDAGKIVSQRLAVSSQELTGLDFETVESRVHFTEYDLVRRSVKVASCWM